MDKRVFCALLGAAVLSFSCSKDSLKQEPIAIDARGLSSLDEVDIHHLGGDVTVAFTADEEWTVGDKPSWLSIEGLTYSGGTVGTSTLTLHADANVSGTDRDIDMPFLSKESGDTLAVLAIRQDAVHFIVQQYTSETDTMRFSWHDYQMKDNAGQPAKDQPGSETISIYSNVKWRMSSDDEEQALFLFSQLTGEGKNAREEQKIQVVPVNPNFELDTVTVKATFVPLLQDGKTPVPGMPEVELVLEQGNLRFLVYWDESSTTFVSTGVAEPTAWYSELGTISGNAPNTLIVDSEELWEVRSFPDWIRMTIGDKELKPGEQIDPGVYSVQVSSRSANPTREFRDGAIVAAPIVDAYDVQDAIRTRNLRQDAYQFELQDEGGRNLSENEFGFDFENDDRFDDADTEIYSVYLLSSASRAFVPFDQAMEITGLPDWMKYTVANVGTRYKIEFSLSKQNLEFHKIETPGVAPVVLQVKRDLFDGMPENMSRNFLFSQAEFLFNITWPAQLESIGCRYTKPFDVVVESSGDWEIQVRYNADSGNTQWFKEEDNTLNGRKGKTTLHVGAATANPNLDRSRSAVVRFISKNHSGSKVESRNMVQTEYQFKVFRRAEDQTAGRPELTAFEKDFQAYIPNELQSNPQSLDERKVYFYLKCDGPWDLISWPPFMTPSQIHSTDENGFMDYIQFRVETGISSRREGEIVVRADNKVEKHIAVAQEAFAFDVRADMTELPAYSAEDIRLGTLTLSPDVKWKLVRDGRTVTPEAVSPGGVIDLLTPLAVNYDSTPITGVRYYVEVTEPSGIPAKQLDFRQAGFLFQVVSSQLSFTEVNSRNREFMVECSGPWHIQEALTQDWLHATPDKAPGSASITVSADVNKETTSRSSRFTLVSDAHAVGGRTWEIPVQVNQSAYKWSVAAADNSELDYSLDPAAPWEKELNIISSSAWSVDIPSWMTMEPSSGDGDESGRALQAKLTSSKNLSVEEARSASVIVQSEFAKDNAALQREIKISQAPFIWAVTSGDWTGESGSRKMAWDTPVNLAAKTFRIHSSGSWQIQSGEDVVRESGKTLGDWKFTWGAPAQDGFVTVSVTPAVNNSREVKSLSAVVASVDHLEAKIDLNEKLTLEQPAYILNVDDKDAKPEEPVLREVAPWNLENESAPQTLTLPVASSAGWTVEVENPDQNAWVTLANKRDASVDVRIANYNGTEKAREAHLLLKSTVAGVTLNQEIVLTQKEFVFKIVNASQTSLRFQAEGGQIDIPIECSASWTVESLPDNNMVTTATRDGDQLHLVISRYTQSAPRVGQVVLDSHGVKLTITVSQGSYKFDITGLNADQPNVFAPVQGSALSFTLVSNVAWTIEIPDWLRRTMGPASDDPNNNEKTYQFTFATASSNQTADANIGEIVLRNDLEEKRFVVRQDGFQTGSVTLADFAEYSAPSQVTEFAASIGWSVDKPSQFGWIHVTPVRGEGATTFNVSVDDNAGASRSGYFEIKDGSGYGLSRKVTVNQKGFEFTVSASSLQFPVIVSPSDRWSFDVKSSSPCNVTVKAGSDASWFSFAPEGIPAGVQTTVTVTPTTNTTEQPRTAVLVVTPVLSGVDAKEITLTQDPFVFDVVWPSQPIAFNPVATSTQTLHISCTNGWSVSTPEWVSASPSSGTGNATVTLSAEAHNGREQRSGSVRVSNGINDKVYAIDAVQDAFVNTAVTLSEFAELDAEAQGFEVVATGAWATAGVPDWVRVSPSSGTGTQNVSVRALDNTTSGARSGSFRISYTATGGYSLERTVSVSQKRFNFNADDVYLAFRALAPGNNTFEVVCSGDWSLSGKPDWISISAGGAPVGNGGSGNMTLTVIPGENLTTSPREATLKVTSSRNPAFSKTIHITQEAYQWNSGAAVIEVGAVNPQPQTFEIVSSGSWTIQDVPAWVSVSPASGSGNATVTVTVESNGSTAARNGSFTVVNADNPSLAKPVTIRQEGFQFIVEPTSLSFAAINPQPRTVTIESNGGWTIPSAGGLNVSPMSGGAGRTEVTVVPSEDNNSAEVRRWTLVVESSAGASVRQEIAVEQAFFEFSLPNYNDVCFQASDLNGVTGSFTIHCSGSWNIMGFEDEDWFSLSQTAGEGNETIVVTLLSNNGSESDRGVYLTITCKDYPNMFLQQLIIQKGAEPAGAQPEAVDLGLPSGLKWASFNVGASKPEEYGDYFAWGETEPYYEAGYAQSKSPVWKSGKESGYVLPSYTFELGTSQGPFSKYVTDSSYGTVDNKTVLDPEDDAAYVNWGGSWRMPTFAECEELLNNCTWTWTSENGVNGYKVTSKNNGNSIFLPAAGCRYNIFLTDAGSYGYYWSSSLNTGLQETAWGVDFASGGVGGGYGNRVDGFSVRPVSE